jgi:hypothetical protein
VEVKDATDAEDRAKKLIREKRPKLRQILFKRVEKKDNSWLIEGEIWFKRLYLFTVKKFFKLQISSETGEATSYQETHFKVWFPGPHA